MDSILGLLKVLVGGGNTTWDNTMMDPTVYQVETFTHIYCGRIQFQDSVHIKLLTEKPRVVKIFKENIKQITIVSTSLMNEKIQV